MRKNLNKENKMAEIEDLINSVVDQDFSKAGPMFQDILGDKIATALEQEKLAVTDQVFNGVEASDEEDTSEEDLEMFSDEELEEYDEEDESEEDDYQAEPSDPVEYEV